MHKSASAPRRFPLRAGLAMLAMFGVAASCSDPDATDSDPGAATGGSRSGSAGNGGSTGGTKSGGSQAGGTKTGGATTSGGTGGSGGTQSGGTGGTSTGGTTTSGGTGGSGGIQTGGTGGTSTGGTGGSGNGGSGGATTPDAGAPDGMSRDANQPDQGRDTQASDGAPTITPAVQLRGRFDHYDTTPALFGWPGSALVARFNGTGATVQLSGSDDRYQVVIDGTPTSVLKVTASGKYEAAKGLPAGTHEMVIWQRTESRWAQVSYLGMEITGGQLLAPPARPGRRIEIYGDSISAGYGVDGVGPNCSVSQDNSNNFLAYGSVAARTLSAELHTIAWSGIGMYRGYGETTPGTNTMTMPKVFDRIMPYAAPNNAWDFASWQPHAVVINLGTNDASSQGDPGTPYRTAYLDFVRGLRKKYPDTFFVLSIGPMLDGASLTAIRGHIQAVMQTRASEGDTKMSYLEYPVQKAADGYGCDWHPSAATQAKMATLLVAELKKQLSW